MSIKNSTPFKEKDEFKYENDYGFDKETVKDIKKSPDHKKNERIKEIVSRKDREFVDVMEDEESARAFVDKTENEKKEKSKKQLDEVANMLDMSLDSYSSYRANVAEWGMWLLMNKYFPQGYEYHCVPTKEGSMNVYGKNFETKDGLIFVLKDKFGGIRVSALRLSYDPMVDAKAVQLMAVNVENTVDFLEGQLEQNEKKKIKEIVDKHGSPVHKTGTKKDN